MLLSQVVHVDVQLLVDIGFVFLLRLSQILISGIRQVPQTSVSFGGILILVEKLPISVAVLVCSPELVLIKLNIMSILYIFCLTEEPYVALVLLFSCLYCAGTTSE